MEEARVRGQQGLLWEKDTALHPGAEGEPAHLQAEEAAHSGLKQDFYIILQ